MERPRTIVDLGQKPQEKPIIGRSMTDDRSTLEARIKQLEDKYKAEQEALERGGYDYDGDEAWAQAMRNVGRR